jgi:hypothetical protein
MSKEPEVLLTTREIEGWERESIEIAKRIADDQERLNELRTKLKMAEFFRPKKPSFFDCVDIPTISNGQSVPAGTLSAGGETEPEGDNLVGAIESLANNAAQPIPKKMLKQMLAQGGFAPDRLANYFYTAIHRLKSKERISVLENGSIWKSPHILEANSN